MINSSTTSRLRWTASLFAVLALSGLLVSCSNKDSEGASKKQDKTKSELSECKGVDIEGEEALPVDCANALFTSRVDQSASKQLRGVRQEKLLNIGHGVCALASAVASDPTQSAGFDDMVKSNAKNWGISEESAREVIDIAQVLCPADMEKLIKLTQNQEPITVQLQATGSAKVLVTYTGTDDDKADQSIDPPWDKKLKVSKAGPVELSVFPSSASGVTTGCKISIGDVEVVSAKGDEGQMAICRVTEGQMRAAAAGELKETTTTAATKDSAKAGD